MTSHSSQPNVLFFLTDQHRPDWVGMHPDVPVRTPNIEQLADRGTWFTNAVCPSPLCGPSRACLATGMEYGREEVPRHGTHGNLEIDAGFDQSATYSARLRDEAGYYVMGCGKFLDKFYGKRGPEGKHRIQEFGYSDGIRNRGKWASAGTVENDRDHVYRCYLLERDLLETHKKDFALRSGTHRDHFAATFPTPLPDEAYCDSWLAQNGLDLIESAPEDRPWHLMVSFIGPHDPLDVTHEMYEWYREDKAVDFPGPAPLGADDGFDGRTHNEIRRNYSAIVENIDHWVGRYLDRLRERDELENTLIVFSSDHGEMLGDHGQWKKHSPYQASAGVPMVVAGPGVEPRGRCEEPVTVLDAHATFLDYAGVTPGDIDSRSLRPFLTGETDAHREVVHSGLGPWRMVYDGRYKLISGYDPDDDNVDQVGEFVELDDEKQQMLLEERNDILFDLRTDPNETQNIIGDRPDIADELSEHLSSVAPS